MMSGLAFQLDRAARRLFPFAFSVLLVVLSVVPLPVPGYGLVVPSFALMAVYYWAIHRPDLLPAPAVFALGLLEDILSGAPTGLNTLVLLLVYGAMRNQRRPFLGKPFAVMWFGFLVVAPAAIFAHWLFASALAGRIIPAHTAFVQLLLTLAFYPWLTWLFAAGQRAFLRQS
ncbi:MAG TPA: rod shape-determining protein MreD [Alphaproteobacteria bacterium]|nr:rod shape-determining protein MreD [Alphaproteobacteria bacterium]